jgi:hypothetical protein
VFGRWESDKDDAGLSVPDVLRHLRR